jgi:hypothetical protein
MKKVKGSNSKVLVFRVSHAYTCSSDFTFPPARFALEAANNYRSHLGSVHQVPITAG